jgi:hypothetical protein
MNEKKRNAIYIFIAIVIIAIIGFFLIHIVERQYDKRQYLKKVHEIEKTHIEFVDKVEKTDQLFGTDANKNGIRDDIERFIKQNLKDKSAIEVASLYIYLIEYTNAKYQLDKSEDSRKTIEKSLKMIQSIEDSIYHISSMNPNHFKELVEQRPYLIDDFILIRQILVKHKEEIFVNNPARKNAYENLIKAYPLEPSKPLHELTKNEMQERLHTIIQVLTFAENKVYIHWLDTVKK